MMEMVHQWLVSVICAALIAAIADGMMPKGAVKQVGKFICALVLLCALLRPLRILDLSEVPYAFGDVAADMERQRIQLEEQNSNILKTIIERQSAAYIVDKAAQLGIECRVQVVCRSNDDTWMTESVSVTGQLDDGQRSQLESVIQRDFGTIPEFSAGTGGESSAVEVAR